MDHERQLEALTRRFGRADRNWGRYALWGVIGIAVLIALFTSFFTVDADGRSVLKRFGAVVSTRDPGLHWKLPFGIETAHFVPTERVLKEEFGFRTVDPGQRTEYRKSERTERESLMLTGDLNVIDVEWVVQYRIRDAVKYLHEVRDPTETIRDIAEAVMRRVVGNRLASDVLTVGRVSIANAVREEMQSILESYDMGVHITGVEMQDVTPPDPVKPAFNEVNEARQQRERLINLAEKDRNQKIPRARGEAEQTILGAEAYEAERVNRAKGESSRFLAILERYTQAKDVMRERLYLEAIDEIGPQLGEVFVIGGNGSPAPLPLFDLRATTAGSDRKGGGR